MSAINGNPSDIGLELGTVVAHGGRHQAPIKVRDLEQPAVNVNLQGRGLILLLLLSPPTRLGYGKPEFMRLSLFFVKK